MSAPKPPPTRQPALLVALAESLEKHPEVLSAYLFGSTATGHAREASDVDIAVRLVPDLSAGERFRIRMAIADDLTPRIERNVDVVLMNDAALILLHQVFSTGIRLFARDATAEERFKTLKQREYFDFRYYLDKDFERTKSFFGVTGHD